MSVEMLRQACGLQFIYEAPTQGPRRYVRWRAASGGRRPTAGDRRSRVKMLLADYNCAGITSIVERTAGDSTVELFRGLKVFLDGGMLTGSACMLAPRGSQPDLLD